MSADSSNKAMNVLITAGGTIAPIDDVRLISNRSTGMFGSKLAEAWLESGADVTYLATTPQTLGPLEIPRVPFYRETNINEVRSRLVEQTIRQWNHASHCHRIDLEHGTVSDYAFNLEKIAKSKTWNVLMLAAAVSDYEPASVSGKIASDAEEITLRLKRTQKVIQSVRGWVGSECLLVGFKLTSGATDAEMIEIAQAACKKNNADFTLVNDQSSLNAGQHRVAMVNLAGKSVWFDPGVDLAARVVAFLVENTRRGQ